MSESGERAPSTWVITNCSVCSLEMIAGASEIPPMCTECSANERAVSDE